MNRQEFINHLTSSGCVVVREARRGYTVVRNVINGKMSGVPVTEPPLTPTMCRVCKTLEIAAPERALISQALIEELHKQFSKYEFLS